MKKFFTNILSSAIGTFVAISLFSTITFFIVISALIFTGEKVKDNLKKPVNKNSTYVFKIELSGNIEERPSSKKQILNIIKQKNYLHTLSSLTSVIDTAKKNKKIKGIYLKINNFTASWSVLKQIQKQLLDFKKSKKFIISFAKNLSEKNYLIASTADKIFLYPEGHIEWNGFHAQFTSIKELLDKIKLQIYVFRTGKFKSAVEPLLSKTISQENKLQIQNLITKRWNYLLNEISRPSVNKKVLNHLAKKYLYLSPEEALKYNFIDNIGTEWDAFYAINKNLKAKNLSAIPSFYNKDQNNFKFYITNIGDINKSKTKSKKCANDKKNICKNNQIAILYLNGDIQEGSAKDNNIGSINTVKILRSIKKNKKIKALVIRVNSPGGSALASDIIWSEIEILKKSIPVVTSIASVAASGAYYLSVGSNFIFAEPSSIVGSIGVFFVRPYTAQLTESLGIYGQNISTHNNVELFNSSEALSPSEQKRIQIMIKKTYDKFKYVIKKGRNLPIDKVSALATGRYWLADHAIKLGLVDKIGNLNDSINKAAELAKIKFYSTTNYPQSSYLDFNLAISLQNLLKTTLLSPFNFLFTNLTGLNKMSDTVNLYLHNINKLDSKGILTLMPDKITYK
ncbi:MAG: signal peptide peptidase SppA [Bdellovibrionales bacterium]|nr:signal peptide peptidase SppA [Bdellovibrionales bacterium]